MSSDTPMTDEYERQVGWNADGSKFARTLERKLAAMTAKLDAMGKVDEMLHKAVHRESELLDKLATMTTERDALRDQLKHYAHGESGVSRLIEERAENSRLSHEVEKLKALLRRHVERIEMFGTRGTAEVALLADSRAALGEEAEK